MAKVTFDELVSKALHDTKFRSSLIRDPKKALSSLGIKATPKMVAALNAVDYASLGKVASAFGRNAGVHPDTALC
jgi:hypothetical protein